MWGFKPKFFSTPKCAITYDDHGYTLSRVNEENKLVLFEQRIKSDRSPTPLSKLLQEDVEKFQLAGAECALILMPSQYQLLQIDAADVPLQELAKALKWRLKGLIDYPLNDIAVDACLIPPHGVANQRKKAIVSVTPLSALKQKLALLADVYLQVKIVSVAELGLVHICGLIPNLFSPQIVVSIEDTTCRLHIIYQNALYLERILRVKLKELENNQQEVEHLVLEIQRSNDYCLSELKIPEPKVILFTPQFINANLLLQYLKESAIKPFQIIDVNTIMSPEVALDTSGQTTGIYSIGGAVMLNDLGKTKPESSNSEEPKDGTTA